MQVRVLSVGGTAATDDDGDGTSSYVHPTPLPSPLPSLESSSVGGRTGSRLLGSASGDIGGDGSGGGSSGGGSGGNGGDTSVDDSYRAWRAWHDGDDDFAAGGSDGGRWCVRKTTATQKKMHTSGDLNDTLAV